jgi:hypothetical protein
MPIIYPPAGISTESEQLTRSGAEECFMRLELSGSFLSRFQRAAELTDTAALENNSANLQRAPAEFEFRRA